MSLSLTEVSTASFMHRIFPVNRHFRCSAVAVLLCFCVAFAGCAKSLESEVTTTSVLTETTAATTTSAAESSFKRNYPDNCIIDPTVFDRLDSSIELVFKDKTIIEIGTVNGRRYSFTVDLTGWKGNTSADQIGELSRLFWQVYPALYERFGVLSNAPCDVILLIENSGYEIAEAWENKIHLHDMWLFNNPEDFDCITHELAHTVQNGWDGDRLEYSSYIERFADYCRFIYCMDNGGYNDHGWTLQTVADEPDRESSVRFLVWLDYKISDGSRDFMKDYFLVCTKGEYASSDWKKAWIKLFQGTAFEGKSIDDVWKEYAGSDFASLSSNAERGETSELLAKYDVRNKTRKVQKG